MAGGAFLLIDRLAVREFARRYGWQARRYPRPPDECGNQGRTLGLPRVIEQGNLQRARPGRGDRQAPALLLDAQARRPKPLPADRAPAHLSVRATCNLLGYKCPGAYGIGVSRVSMDRFIPGGSNTQEAAPAWIGNSTARSPWLQIERQEHARARRPVSCKPPRSVSVPSGESVVNSVVKADTNNI